MLVAMSQPPPMNPPFPGSQASREDRDHLRILSVLHYVAAGLAVLGLLFLFGHYTIMKTVMDPGHWDHQGAGGPPPEAVLAMMRWFCLIGALLLGCIAAGNFMSARMMSKRVNRTFSMVVAGVNCIQFPIGTLLGVFTLMVLLRDSVRRIYEDA